MKSNRLLLTLAAPVVAIVFALLASVLALALTGNPAGEVFGILVDQLTSVRDILRTLNRAGPYYVSGVAVAIGFKMNLFNIGVEGQYRVAMFAAAVAGAYVNLPAVLHVTFCIVVAMATGALWAAIPAVLKAYRGVSEVISTIMLNYIATGVLAFLFSEVFAIRIPGDLLPKTKEMPRSSWMPNLIEENLHNIGGFLLVAVGLGVAYYLLVWRSRFGFRLRASGTNPTAARTAGIDPRSMIFGAMLLSGAAAGLVGLPQLLGERHAYSADLTLGLGFSGIAVALLGRNSPVGVAFAALTFGFLDSAARFLDLVSIPKEIVTIMQGILVLTVVIVYEIGRRTKERRTQERASRTLGTLDPLDEASA